MNSISDAKMITCILPKGKAIGLQQAIIQERGIDSVNFHRGRGVGRSSRGSDGIGAQQEREVLEVIIPADKADELFSYIYDKVDIGEQHGGIMYMQKVPKVSVLTMPDLPREKD
ncbi:MAG: hypothetical protein KJP04_10935 [Arenicella sp.]|nr:hypothetical protein [Arenicella sp.]